MCGIAGIVMKNGQAPRQDLLDALRCALAHRGPDGSGDYISQHIGFVHTRLAIIDPAGGVQPLHGDGIVLAGNGEIYNYVELNRELGPQDYRTASDFEPVMKLLAQDGTAAFRQLRGMYAQASHTLNDNQVVIARDRYGIKPLYYADTPMFFAFASEPRALMQLPGIGKIFAPEMQQQLLQAGAIHGRQTIYRDIKRLLPGEIMTIGGASERIPTLPKPNISKLSFTDALREFDRKFENSVMLHQRSDVPYGMFLSGGLDSTAVLTMMARLNGQPVTTFTCGFAAETAADERPRARETARALGANHHEVEFTENDFWTLLPQVAAALDDPIIDYATLPTFKLAMEARRHVKVILSGEGGDEALGGYGRYRKAMRPWPFSYRAKGRFSGMHILRDEKFAVTKTDMRGTALQRAQAVDFAGWLPDNLLIKLDRCLMAHGIEGRTPFLEPQLTDFCFSLPDGYKVQKGLGKYLLREWLMQHGPKNMDYFNKKQGFTVPVGEWIMAKGRQLAPLIAGNAGIAQITKKNSVEKLFTHGGKKEMMAAWSLLFYACWHAVHIENKKPGGDVFALLA